MKIKFNPLIQLGALALVFIVSISSSSAQINPLGAQYFQNQYLANPAMAGYQSGMRLNLGYRNQWDNIPGSPKNVSVTGDYGTEKVGVGINFFKDEAGLLNRSRIQGSYAYHLPLNDDSKKLHFGISLGLGALHRRPTKVLTKLLWRRGEQPERQRRGGGGRTGKGECDERPQQKKEQGRL